MYQDVFTEVTQSADLHPLQYLAAARVNLSICETEDVLCMIHRFRKSVGNCLTGGFLDGQWRQLRGKARRKLYRIGLPNLIIDIALENLWAISFEILKWIQHHAEDTGIDYPSDFCWTRHLSIDYVETAKLLTKNEEVDIKKRFKLACFYCLDFEARFLWEQMSLAEKRFFYVRGNLEKSDLNPIVLYWTYHIQEVPIDFWRSKALSHTQLLKFSVEKGYLSATKFFLGKQKAYLRNARIIKISDIYLRKLFNPGSIVKDHLAIACFLVCQLDSAYRERLFFDMFYFFFYYFLEWPWQKHFMTVFCRIRPRRWERIAVELLSSIFEKVLGGFRDYDYKGLFVEFWHYCPDQSRLSVRTESSIGAEILLKFVKKHFGFVLEEKSFVLKKKFRGIVLQREIAENEAYFEKENVEFFKVLVREQITTKSSIHTFTQQRVINFRYPVSRTSFFNVPLGELMYLIDGLLETVFVLFNHE